MRKKVGPPLKKNSGSAHGLNPLPNRGAYQHFCQLLGNCDSAPETPDQKSMQ